MNYEIRLLNCIIDQDGYSEAVNAGAENVFVEYRDIWNFVISHFDEHRKFHQKIL